jgi:hypothetical protein
VDEALFGLIHPCVIDFFKIYNTNHTLISNIHREL